MQVSSGDTVSILPVASVTTATAFAFVPSPEGYRVGDAERQGVAHLDASGAEIDLLSTWARPVDVEYATLFEQTVIATTSALLSFDTAGYGAGGCSFGGGEMPTALAMKEERSTYTVDDDDGPRIVTYLEARLALTTRHPRGGALYSVWWEGAVGDEPYADCAPQPMPESPCVLQPDAVAVDAVTGDSTFVGDSACDRVFVSGEGVGAAELGPGAAGGVSPNPNRMTWSEDRGRLFVAEASSLFVLDEHVASVEEISGFDRATAVAGSIGGRTIWVGSAALDSASSPVLYTYRVGAPLARSVAFPGASIVDVDYFDRAPVFPEVWAWTGSLVASARRGRRGYYEVKAVDPDGDAVEIAVQGPVPDALHFDADTHSFVWTIACDESEDYWRVRVTATAGRYRSPIDLLVWIDDEEEEDGSCEDPTGLHVPTDL